MSTVNSIDLTSKQEALDPGLKAIQYYFMRNLDHARNARILFVFGEVKKNIFDFWQGTVKYTYFKTILSTVSAVKRDIFQTIRHLRHQCK